MGHATNSSNIQRNTNCRWSYMTIICRVSVLSYPYQISVIYWFVFSKFAIKAEYYCQSFKYTKLTVATKLKLFIIIVKCIVQLDLMLSRVFYCHFLLFESVCYSYLQNFTFVHVCYHNWCVNRIDVEKELYH